MSKKLSVRKFDLTRVKVPCKIAVVGPEPGVLTGELVEHLQGGSEEHQVLNFSELTNTTFDSRKLLTVIVKQGTPVSVRLTGLIVLARYHPANIVFESHGPVLPLIKANADYIFVKPSDDSELLAWAWPDPNTLDCAKDVWKQLVQFHCWHVLDTRSGKVYWYPPTSAAAEPVQSYWTAFWALLGWK